MEYHVTSISFFVIAIFNVLLNFLFLCKFTWSGKLFHWGEGQPIVISKPAPSSQSKKEKSKDGGEKHKERKQYKVLSNEMKDRKSNCSRSASRDW